MKEDVMDHALLRMQTLPVSPEFFDETGYTTYFQWARDNIDVDTPVWNAVINEVVPSYTVALLKNIIRDYIPSSRRYCKGTKVELKEL